MMEKNVLSASYITVNTTQTTYVLWIENKNEKNNFKIKNRIGTGQGKTLWENSTLTFEEP